jgi:hypothetical protein
MELEITAEDIIKKKLITDLGFFLSTQVKLENEIKLAFTKFLRSRYPDQ